MAYYVTTPIFYVERGPAPRARVHDDRRRHPRPPHAPARRGGVLPHGHRRARRAGRAGGRARGRHAEGARRPQRRALQGAACRGSTSPTTSSSAPPTRATSARSRRSCSASTTTATPTRAPTRAGTAPAARTSRPRTRSGRTRRARSTRSRSTASARRTGSSGSRRFQEPLEKLYAEQPDFVQPRAPVQRGARVHHRRPARRQPQPLEAAPGASRCRGTREHVFYVWFDALLNYYTALSLRPRRRGPDATRSGRRSTSSARTS